MLGGVSHTPGLIEYLEWRVGCCWNLASDSTEGIERVEVVRLPKGVEPESVTWRGAATLPALETLHVFGKDIQVKERQCKVG